MGRVRVIVYLQILVLAVGAVGSWIVIHWATGR